MPDGMTIFSNMRKNEPQIVCSVYRGCQDARNKLIRIVFVSGYVPASVGQQDWNTIFLSWRLIPLLTRVD